MLTHLKSRISIGRDHHLVREFISGFRIFISDRSTLAATIGFLTVLFLGIFGPVLAPYNHNRPMRDSSGDILYAEPPSGDHLLGTTTQGFDVFSSLLYGARPTLIAGLSGGTLLVSIALVVGVVSGYRGGMVDEVLMRITDFFYGIPFIPTAIVIVAYFGVGFWETIAIIGFLLWRGNARVFRSQVLQIKERSYIQSARSVGAGDLHIMVKHILPNMGGMIVLFLALGIGTTILIEASLAFLGFTSPFTPTWGIMLQSAYDSGGMIETWWWTLPPGFAIGFTVLTTFMIGQGYERVQTSRTGGA